MDQIVASSGFMGIGAWEVLWMLGLLVGAVAVIAVGVRLGSRGRRDDT